MAGRQRPADTEAGPRAAHGGHGLRDKKPAEHAAVCDNASRLITVIEAAGHTVTHSDAVYGFGGCQRDRDHRHLDMNTL